MRTDEPLYVIFRHEPRWLFALANQPDPGPCEFRSEEFKSIARTCDGLIDPMDPAQGITIAEFQLSAGDDPYLRAAEEMLGVQRASPDRKVQGFIFFGKGVRDPASEPWNRLVTVYRFEDAMRELASREPEHPLVHLLFPIVEDNNERLEQDGAEHYRALLDQQQQGGLTPMIPAVFVDLFWKRLSGKSREEIHMILQFNDLPAMMETVMGKEIWEDGHESGLKEGREEGLRKVCLNSARRKFGRLDEVTTGRINHLSGDQAEELTLELFTMTSIEALTTWLDEQAPVT